MIANTKDCWATALSEAAPGEGLAMAQRAGPDALFLLRRAEGLVELEPGRIDASNLPGGRAASSNNDLRSIQQKARPGAQAGLPASTQQG